MCEVGTEGVRMGQRVKGWDQGYDGGTEGVSVGLRVGQRQLTICGAQEIQHPPTL